MRKDTYKCNACGSHPIIPIDCSECGSQYCPDCKRAGSLMNLVEWDRMVSHAIPSLASARKGMNQGSTKVKSKPRKPRQNKQQKIGSLLAELGIGDQSATS